MTVVGESDRPPISAFAIVAEEHPAPAIGRVPAVGELRAEAPDVAPRSRHRGIGFALDAARQRGTERLFESQTRHLIPLPDSSTLFPVRLRLRLHTA